MSLASSCNNNGKQAGKEISRENFDKVKWQTKLGRGYPYRDQMLQGILTNKKLHGLKRERVLDMLGRPNRAGTNYLFYRITQTYIADILPFHTKALVIKFAGQQC